MSDRHLIFSQPSESAGARLISGGARPRAFTFVQLVFESRGIAVGTVAAVSADGTLPITLSVERSFPAGLPQQLRIVNASAHQMEMPLSFAVNERVVLFLEEVRQGEAVLLGAGDVGKWPRQRPDWLFTAGHVRPLPEVVQIIGVLLRIHAMNTYEERVHGLLNELIPAGPLGQIAAAQYATNSERWDEVQPTKDVGLADARLVVAAKLLSAPGQHDPAVEYAVLELLTSAPASIAISLLIERLNDPDAAVRDTAFGSLQTVALPYTQEQFGYQSSDPPAQRLTAVQRWQEWWVRQRSARLRQEVPKMLEDLDSPHPLRRLAADWSLRILSRREVGYQAEDSVERRREGITRWQVWWREFSQQLK